MKLVTAMALSLFMSQTYAQEQNSIQEDWKGFSDPEIMSSGFTHKLSDLPMEGTIAIGPRAWSGDYWSSKKGGINLRWNSPSPVGFNYASPTKAQVALMSLAELATLAPTEKYDLFMGRYDYPLKEEATSYSSKLASDWAGICHGWAPATLHHNEPTPKVMTNPDGIQIPFGSADIKALVSYYYAFHYEAEESSQMGLRCFFGKWMGAARGCGNDLNAGAFHIVIANKLGLKKEGFLADVDRYREVWNQPVVGFKSVVVDHHLSPSSGAAKSAVKEMRIQTEFIYVDEVETNAWEVIHGTKDQKLATLKLQYRIELNTEGKIVGGDWESQERPDFLWDKPKTTSFVGTLSGLSLLLND